MRASACPRWRAPGGGASPHPPARTGQSSAPNSRALPGNCWPSTWSLFFSLLGPVTADCMIMTSRYSVPPQPLQLPSCLALSQERGARISWTVTKKREVSIMSFSDTLVLVLQDCSRASVTSPHQERSNSNNDGSRDPSASRTQIFSR